MQSSGVRWRVRYHHRDVQIVLQATISSQASVYLGANRAPAGLAKQLRNYPELGRAAARRIPNAKLIEFPELEHAPQIQAPDQFHEALSKGINAR